MPAGDTNTFAPQGKTVLVGTSAVTVPLDNAAQICSYRVRCLVTGYLAWGYTGAPCAATAVAPADGAPVERVLGMTAGGVESFKLPSNARFVSSAIAGFEVTPGMGQ